jgi:dihydropyrimidinase
LETRLPLLFSEGVLKGRLTLNEFVALTSTNAAKIYGLHPRKGSLAIGSDADITIWDPKWGRTITQDMLHDNMDYTPYEGMEVKGWPRIVIIRGRVAVEEETLKLDRGAGEFLKRTPAKPGLEPLPSSPLSPLRNFGANLL